VEFDLSVDLDAAANDVRDKVSAAVRNLPQDSDPPIVAKSDANAETIFSLTVQSDKKSLLELTELGNNVFKERLQTIKGIKVFHEVQPRPGKNGRSGFNSFGCKKCFPESECGITLRKN
jgi:multidrug efflux pump subunit AcrB